MLCLVGIDVVGGDLTKICITLECSGTSSGERNCIAIPDMRFQANASGRQLSGSLPTWRESGCSTPDAVLGVLPKSH